MNNKGQITVEYILLIGIILILIVFTINIILNETEKNTILVSAQSGAQIGIDKNGYAMYYNDTFNNYEENYPKLLQPIEIQLINITMQEKYKTITLQAYLHTNQYLTNNEKYIIGYRVNYYIRKSISETFNKEQNDLYYENLQTNNYMIETENVKWV